MPAAATTTTGAGSAELLALRDIHKRYGGVQALRGVDFDVRRGEVHALVGQNGAGKSTLIKAIAGAERPDSGEVRVDGRTVAIGSTAEAFTLGLATVYQEPQVLPLLSVTENVFMGRELRDRFGNVDMRRQRARVRELLASLGLDEALADRSMGSLNLAAQQLVLICKALSHEARLVVYDEPSAILTGAESERLFGVIRRLREQGVATVYISHRLEEVFAIADRVTVLRDGAVTLTGAAAELSIPQVVEAMTGSEHGDSRPERRSAPGDVVLAARGLSAAGRFDEVDFELRRGEVLALFGLMGSGATDVALALFGLAPAERGEVEVDGRPVRLRSPAAARRRGIALLPKDRKSQGLFAPLSLAFNVSMGNLRRLVRARLFVDRGSERRATDDAIRNLAIKAPGIDVPVSGLSGGNQQKALIARQLLARPRVLILDEPTRGVDVAAKQEIHRLVLSLADEGAAVLLITSELPEALQLADRVLVLRGGRVAGHFEGDALAPNRIMEAALGTAVREDRDGDD